MSDSIQHRCPNCGGALTVVDNDSMKCKYCGSSFENRSMERHIKGLQEILDQAKIDYINNQRRNLYDAVHAKYISMSEVRQYATEIKKHLPDDFQANFYLQVISGDVKEINRAIRRIDVDEHYDSLAAIIHFLIASLQIEYLLELNHLVERAYKKRDLTLFSRYATEISEEAEKVEAGIYATGIPRDVFIAYSSKDMEHVSALCEELEAQGISCFVAARNLRHGVGAVENYDSALREAMDNCRCFVFVSTINSRSLACDAVTKEIPYIRSCDIANAPAKLRNNYAAIPAEYKKPRVEYRIGTKKSSDAGSKITDAFFEGYEWAYTTEAVAIRAAQLLYEIPVMEGDRQQLPPISTQIKKKKKRAPLVIALSLLLAGVIGAGAWLVPPFLETSADPVGTEDTPANDNQSSDTTTQTPGTENGFEDIYIEPETVENASVGLSFAKVGEGVCFVTGLGTCTDRDIVIPAISPEGDRVAGIGNEAFLDCTELTSIDLPNTITYIGKSAFEYCLSLNRLEIPSNVREISDLAVAYCAALTSISLPASVRRIGTQAFLLCEGLSEITVDPANEAYLSIGNCLIERSTQTVIAGCASSTLPTDGSITIIGESAFQSMGGFTSLEIPDGITTIGTRAFWHCLDLSSVSIPASVQQIGAGAFCGTSLTTISADVNNPTYHSDGNCLIETASKTLILGSSHSVIPTDGSVTVIGEHAFHQRYFLTAIDIPKGVTTIGTGAFDGCPDLSSVTLPGSITAIEANAFRNCTKLTDIYYAGTEAQWQAVAIGEGNEALANATIHYNSTK